MKPSLKHIFFSVWALLGLLSLVSSQEKACSADKECPWNQVCLRVGGEKKCVKKGTCRRACGKGSRCRLSSSKRVECTECPAGSQLVLKKCIKSDLWSAWGPWSSCSVTCGSGTQERKRSCENSCCTGIGNSTELRPCHAQISICEYGEWTAWESWSECSNSHGGCNRTRVRNCEGGLKCKGNEEVVEECNASKCPEWGEWSAWSECSASCNGGLKNRNRSCSGDICQGNNKDIELCNNIPCNGSWGAWGPWGVCSLVDKIRKSMSRTRSCSNGDFCEGNGEEHIPCGCKRRWTFLPETKNCYIVLHKKRNWSEARAECRNIGGDLATIRSEEENEFVHTLAGGIKTSAHVWIGPSENNGTYQNWASGSYYDDPIELVCMRRTHEAVFDRGSWYWCKRGDVMNAVCESDAKK